MLASLSWLASSVAAVEAEPARVRLARRALLLLGGRGRGRAGGAGRAQERLDPPRDPGHLRLAAPRPPLPRATTTGRRYKSTPAGGVITREDPRPTGPRDACSSTTTAAAAAMGSFKGHVLPGTLFLLVGAWHVWAAVARFAADPLGFRLRVWNPVGTGGGGKPRHLELYIVAGGAFLDMCIEVLYSTHLHIFALGGRGQSSAPQRPRARRHVAHVLPRRRTRAHLTEHQATRVERWRKRSGGGTEGRSGGTSS